MEPDPVQSRILIGLLSLHHQAKFGQYTNVFCTQISEDIFEVNRITQRICPLRQNLFLKIINLI